MLRKFRFFHGMVGARLVSIDLPMENVRITQPRYPRVPMRLIAYPEEYPPELKREFRHGWRACEQGRDIYENPYSVREELIYSLYRAWERGWLECYHNHPSRNR